MTQVITKLYSQFNFEAAHHLQTLFPKEHPNSSIHGHSFRVKVVIASKDKLMDDVLIDLGELEDRLNNIRYRLDHKLLNEIEGLQVPTLENIAYWIVKEINPKVKGLVEVSVNRDSCGHGCVVTLVD